MNSFSPDSAVVHRISYGRFELQLDGGMAFVSYRREGDRVVLDHTFVPVALRGKGLAATVVRAALDEARRQQWQVVPLCEYVAAFIERHPAYADLVAKQEPPIRRSRFPAKPGIGQLHSC